MSFDRRHFLALAPATFAALPLSRRAFAAAADAAPPPAAPVARIEVVRDTYFGETLADPYRWMENDKDPDWLPFLQGPERAHPRRARRHSRAATRCCARIQQLSGDTALTAEVQRAGGHCSSSSGRRAPTTTSCSCARTAATACWSIPPR